LEGVDFLETFAPVVSELDNVRLMLILSLVLGLATHQEVDYATEFQHAPNDDDPDLEFMSLEERKRLLRC
jgi:hypothetical protein